MADHLQTFLTALENSITDSTFVKLTLSGHHGRDSSLRKVLIKVVTLARGEQLCFVYRHAAKDVTKNWPIAEGVALVGQLLQTEFAHAYLFTTTEDVELTVTKNSQARLRFAKPTHALAPSKAHNRAKHRLVASAGAPYLALLGVTTKDGAVKKGMEAKYRQINKFVEIVASLLHSSSLKNAESLAVLDMGSGKGYLTFALYDYLTNTLKKQVSITGVELRRDLVELCNNVAQSAGFSGLHFACGDIQSFAPGKTDVLIALHACNTATDEALFKAINLQAALILCAPCCHQELRPQMKCSVPGLDKMLKFGILLERQAESVTDGLRALLLECFGYKTSVFEFISTEHTSKNIMIAAIKTPKAPDRKAMLAQIDALKKAFGIQSHRLETLLASELRS